LNSVAQLHPEYKLYLCLADRIEGFFDPAYEIFSVIEAEDLNIPKFRDFALRYDIFEFNTALKPFMFRWLFNHTDLDSVIYLDSDICAYSRFDHLETLLSSKTSVVLTPHITKPVEDGKTPNDYHMLRAGIFNLGFVAARRCAESMEFMDWWARRLLSQCISDVQASLFVDQKWCDLAPCFLDSLQILRADNYNVAYWNLSQRTVRRTLEGQWEVNGTPLTFFHFSGFNPENDREISKHQNRFAWEDVPEIHPLFQEYVSELWDAGWGVSRYWPYAYGILIDGTEVNRIVRLLYRELYPVPIELDHIDLHDFLTNICTQPVEIPGDKDLPPISRLMHIVYRLRPDVQVAFSLLSSQGRRQFTEWFNEAAEREYGLPRCLTSRNRIYPLARCAHSSSIGVRLVAVAYRIRTKLEATARRLSKFLPPLLRTYLKRHWIIG
jgi:hypothetical protein